MTVDDDVEPAEVLVNDANVVWTSISGTPSPDEERNGTDGVHNSGVLNDYRNETDDSVAIDTSHDITKTLITPAGGNVTVGSEVTYRIVYDLPDATIPRVVIEDTIGEGLRYFDSINYATVTFPDGSTANIDPTVVGNNGAPGSSTLTWEWVGDSRIAPSGGVMGDLEIEFTVLVANVIENQDGVTIPNSVSGTYYDVGGTTHTDTDTSADVTVNEPVVTIDKDDGTGGISVPDNAVKVAENTPVCRFD